MPYIKLDFGKHKRKTLPQIMFRDPDWFFWACKKNVFENKGAISREADDILKKCKSIKIPHNESKEFVIEYCFSHQNGCFCGLEKVPCSREPHAGSSTTYRLDVIDFSLPFRLKNYDKLGYKLFLNQVIYILFGISNNTKVPKKRCEEFFDNKSNFL